MVAIRREFFTGVSRSNFVYIYIYTRFTRPTNENVPFVRLICLVFPSKRPENRAHAGVARRVRPVHRAGDSICFARISFAPSAKRTRRVRRPGNETTTYADDATLTAVPVTFRRNTSGRGSPLTIIIGTVRRRQKVFRRPALVSNYPSRELSPLNAATTHTHTHT